MKHSVYICFIFLSLLFACKQPQSEVFDIAIEQGQIIDIATGKISVKTLLITNGRIAKIIEANASFSYQAKTTIHAKDRYVLPGFWDNHIHLRGGEQLIEENKALLPLFIANGITTVRDAGGDLTTSVLQWRQAIANNELIGPTIFTSGPKIDGPDARWAGSLAVTSKESIATALDSLQAIPSDFVKLYDSRISAAAYLETLRQAEKRGLVTSGHMPFTVTLDETVSAGIDAIEHLYYILKGCSAAETTITEAIVQNEIGFWDSMTKLITTYDDATALRTFNHLKRENAFVVPTLHIGNVLSHLDEVDHSDDPYLQLMGPGIKETYEGRIKSALNATAAAKKSRKELQRFFKQLTLNLKRNKVKLLAGSDAGAYNSYTYPGVSLHREMEAMVAAGLSPLEALQTSAYNGADFLEKTADYGSIEVGKIADLVLLFENPLEDIRQTRNIDQVVTRDLCFSPREIAKTFECSSCVVSTSF